MTVDKFGGHISHKYSETNGYFLCFISLIVRDVGKIFTLGTDKTFVSYKINELTNTWIYPLPTASTIQRCRVFSSAINFIINDRLVNTLEGETLFQGDTILVVRSLHSPKTGDGIVELVVKAPIFIDNDYK